MAKSPPPNMPHVTPLLAYEDVAKSLDWLHRAFGFAERMRLPGPNGKIMHAEMEIGAGVVMLGLAGEVPDSKNPRSLGGTSQTTYVYVADVDKHHEQAKRAGAAIETAPQTMFWGDRTYIARDPEGHRWLFAQHVKDVSPADMQPSNS